MTNFAKNLISISIFLFALLTLTACENNSNKTTENGNKVDFSRTSIDKYFIDSSDSNNNENNDKKEAKETELSSFSTPLKSGVANRIINIKLTCGKINERIFKNGETFSFNQIVGPCTAEEGYKEAEIYVNKQIKFALGGGNCQVSTTLYNAVVAVPRN